MADYWDSVFPPVAYPCAFPPVARFTHGAPRDRLLAALGVAAGGGDLAWLAHRADLGMEETRTLVMAMVREGVLGLRERAGSTVRGEWREGGVVIRRKG